MSLSCSPRRSPAFLERTGVKLLVVACFSATAAALPALQERFATPIVGVVMPGARAAVQSSRYRRIGVLATEATVASGSYVRAIHSLDAASEVHQQACPGLATFIQEGDVSSQEVIDAVRRYTAPLKEKRPDVVIMGCTHYPLVAPMLQRLLGRDVTLVNPALEIAREVGDVLERQGIARRDDREGEYSFFCTGDVETFRAVGARFLQMPLGEVRQVGLTELGRRRGAMSSRFVVRAALYAALYAVLTLAPGLNALAYGPVQFRLSEALLVFACVDPAAVPGLTIGTALGNLNSPMLVADVLFGSLLTLVAASLMQRIGPRFVALLVPVVVNGLGVAAMLAVVLDLPFWASAVWVGAGETAVMATAGAALLVLVRQRREIFGLTQNAA